MFPEIYISMLKKFTEKTKADKIHWYEMNHNGEVILRYGDYITRIDRMGDTLFSDYQIKIEDRRGDIDLFSVSKDDEHFNDIGELYIEALRQARNVKQIVHEIEQNLDAK